MRPRFVLSPRYRGVRIRVNTVLLVDLVARSLARYVPVRTIGWELKDSVPIRVMLPLLPYPGVDARRIEDAGCPRAVTTGAINLTLRFLRDWVLYLDPCVASRAAVDECRH